MTLHVSSDPEIESVVFDEAAIAGAIERLAAAIVEESGGEPILLLGVLKGAFFLTADLARALGRRSASPSSVAIDFLAVSSYGNRNRSSGEVRLLKDTTESLEGRNVVLVEDIVDNGLTLTYLHALLAGRAPRTLRTAVLLDKPYHRQADVRLDYVGLTAPDAFIVGYGLDYQERYRALPYVARLHPWVFSEETHPPPPR